MEAEATKAKPKMKQPQGAKLGIKVGKRGQATKVQRKRKLKKLERVRPRPLVAAYDTCYLSSKGLRKCA